MAAKKANKFSPSKIQQDKIISFIQLNKDLANPNVKPVTNQTKLWAAFEKIMGFGPGTSKRPDSWKQYWNELRSRVQDKCENAIRLSIFERRVADICGFHPETIINKRPRSFLAVSSDDDSVDDDDDDKGNDGKNDKSDVGVKKFITAQNGVLLKEIQAITAKYSEIQKRKIEILKESLDVMKEANRLRQIKIDLLKKHGNTTRGRHRGSSVEY